MPIWQGGVYEVRFVDHCGIGVAGRSFCRLEVFAEDTAPRCEVPAYLLTSESTLSKVADAVKNGRPLDILVIGSRSSTIPASEPSAYPARLQAMLKEKLPGLTVNVAVELQTKKTAEDVAAGLASSWQAKSPFWSFGRPALSMLCDPLIPTIFAARSTRALLHCKIPVPT